MSADSLREALTKHSHADSAALNERLRRAPATGTPPLAAPTAPTAPDWTYQPPHIPSAKPLHRYYRAKYISMQPLSKSPGAAFVTLFRYSNSSQSTLILESCIRGIGAPAVEIYAPAELDRPSMLALRDALNDALHDIDRLAPPGDLP